MMSGAPRPPRHARTAADAAEDTVRHARRRASCAASARTVALPLSRRHGASTTHVGTRPPAAPSGLRRDSASLHRHAGIGVARRPGHQRRSAANSTSRQTSLRSLEPFADILTIVQRRDIDPADTVTARRSAAIAKCGLASSPGAAEQNAGSDVHSRISLDQLFAQRFGNGDPSMQLSSMSTPPAAAATATWSIPTRSARRRQRPLPMMHDAARHVRPNVGVPGDGAPPAEPQQAGGCAASSTGCSRGAARLAGTLGPPSQSPLTELSEHIREIERRIRIVGAQSHRRSPEYQPHRWALPVPLAARRADVDLQVLASRTTWRGVFTLKLGRDGSNRGSPESGFKGTSTTRPIAGGRGGEGPQLRDTQRLCTSA